MQADYRLQDYLNTLWRRWWLIIGLGLLAALATLLLGLMRPKAYEASALVLATKYRESLQFTATSSDARPTYLSYSQLALSDGVIAATRARLAQGSNNVSDLDEILKGLQARRAGDPSAMQLAVAASNPDLAVKVVNTWAGEFVARANEVYGPADEQSVRFFADQVERAAADLAEADEALAQFRARDVFAVLEAQRASAQADYESHLSQQKSLGLTLARLLALRSILISQPADSHVQLADDLTLLLLQITALGSQASSPDIQLQVQNGSLAPSERRVGDLLLSADSLLATLKERLTDLESETAALEPQILALQGQRQAAAAEGDRLREMRTMRDETYVALSQKLQEARIAAEGSRGELTIASLADEGRPVASGTLFRAAIAGLSGLLLGTLAALLLDWWRERDRARSPLAADSGADPAPAARQV